jgi:NADP-reducing hydrogenase subunit HndD
MEKVLITINNKPLTAKSGETILDVAKRNNIHIPTLCNHPDLPPRASCRLCLIEANGRVTTSCNLLVKEGLEIITDTPEIAKMRKLNLELLFGEHATRCGDCSRSHNCTLLNLTKEFEADIHKFKQRKKITKKIQYGKVMQYESDKCIECGNCVLACQRQEIFCLKMINQAQKTEITPVSQSACIACGQCALHCPVGAIHAKTSIPEVKKQLLTRRKKIVFQFAPAVRVSIGEEFDMPPGSSSAGKLVAALKKLGADWVIDVDLGADITTIAEARELKERIEKGGKLPMFTSCCPAWVNYVEMHRPDLIPNLTTIRSPHIISGAVIKHFFAKQERIKPQDIYVVSIMPCTAKKVESQRQELNYKNIKPVDAVLTTREIAHLLKSKNINLAKLEDEESDKLFSSETGSGTIYGSTGGVMEAAVRSAYRFITGEEMKNIVFEEARGLNEIKTAALKIGEIDLKIAVANGLRGAVQILEQLKKEPNKYDYIEVMACPGGCIGGGGQPFSTDDSIRAKRQSGLYSIDEKNTIRYAHQNPVVKNIFRDFLTNPKIYKKILETSFQKKDSYPTITTIAKNKAITKE